MKIAQLRSYNLSAACPESLIQMAREAGAEVFATAGSEKIRITRQFEERFWLLPVGGSLVPVVDRVFPIGAAEAAHADVREYRNIGKVILEVQGVG